MKKLMTIPIFLILIVIIIGCAQQDRKRANLILLDNAVFIKQSPNDSVSFCGYLYNNGEAPAEFVHISFTVWTDINRSIIKAEGYDLLIDQIEPNKSASFEAGLHEPEYPFNNIKTTEGLSIYDYDINWIDVYQY